MAQPPPARIIVRDLVKRYGAVQALSGVNFEVEAGHIFGLLGPNGAGKTSTLECMLGLRYPDRGVIRIDGLDPRKDARDLKRRVGAQLQGSSLQDKITPLEAIRLFSAFHPVVDDEAQLLERFGLREKARAPFDSLSAGQRQRLFLALAFVHRPSVVILDEPTTGLDPHSRRQLHALMMEARARGVAVVLSTHDLDEAETLCDRIGILYQGKIIAEGSPSELVAKSGARTSWYLQTKDPLRKEEIESLPGVITFSRHKGGWRIESPDGAGVLAEFARRFSEREILDLRLMRPTLEDVFLELTGSAWSAQDISVARAEQ